MSRIRNTARNPRIHSCRTPSRDFFRFLDLSTSFEQLNNSNLTMYVFVYLGRSSNWFRKTCHTSCNLFVIINYFYLFSVLYAVFFYICINNVSYSESQIDKSTSKPNCQKYLKKLTKMTIKGQNWQKYPQSQIDKGTSKLNWQNYLKAKLTKTSKPNWQMTSKPNRQKFPQSRIDKSTLKAKLTKGPQSQIDKSTLKAKLTKVSQSQIDKRPQSQIDKSSLKAELKKVYPQSQIDECTSKPNWQKYLNFLLTLFGSFYNIQHG